MYGPVAETAIVYNCYDDAEILHKAEKQVPEEEVRTIIAVGRLTAQKGFDRLLRVHKRLIDAGIRYQLKSLARARTEKRWKPSWNRTVLLTRWHCAAFKKIRIQC